MSLFARPFAVLALLATPALAADAPHAHDSSAPAMRHGTDTETRNEVVFPEHLKRETLSSMRDHLLAVQEITAYLADKKFDDAAEAAENRLGMGSPRRHGAHEVARHMPLAMREIGHGMHSRASEFALEARDAAITGEVGPALAALARTQQSCVACHAATRLR